MTNAVETPARLALRGGDPTLVANVRGILDEKKAFSEAMNRARIDQQSGTPEEVLYAIIALQEETAEYPRLDARLTAALHAQRDAP